MPQDKKPIGKESFKEESINRDYMEETKGGNYPHSGEEIDLMKYFPETKPNNFYDKRVANKKDVLGLLWLTKLK